MLALSEINYSCSIIVFFEASSSKVKKLDQIRRKSVIMSKYLLAQNTLFMSNFMNCEDQIIILIVCW